MKGAGHLSRGNYLIFLALIFDSWPARAAAEDNVKIIKVRRPLAMNYEKSTPTNQLLIRFLRPEEKNFFSELKFLAFSVIIF